ncbi:hypothetical protein [Pantoea agglomerans]|uniref:hypothetical protein n=1 Tax=Enterobacter agglomerans TaxID=549 RepID=UPI0024136E1A|nr:hypothetical protein [Pantoea agglomerans]
MLHTNIPILWAMVALALGFIAGYVIGLFRWKNNPATVKAELSALKEDWRQAEARFQALISELKAKLDEKSIRQPQEARNDASKKSLLEN